MLNKITISTFFTLLTLAVWSQTSVDAPGNGTEMASASELLDPQHKIELYPNPAVDYIIVQVSRPNANNLQFELHSIIGNSLEIVPEELGDGRYRIALKDLATGYYFLVVKDEIDRFKVAQKFLKK